MALATRPKPKTHHKKRQALHHRHSKPYLKAYWPYLPMLCIVALGLAVNSVWSNAHVLGSSTDFTDQTLLTSTNKNRATSGESALTIDPKLSAAAQAKAADMVNHDYWAHTSPDGQTPWTFITSSGYDYQQAGENLAYGFNSATDVVRGWMNSQEHRENILNNDYQSVGFGVATAANYQGHGPQTIVVAEYAEPASSAAHITFQVDNKPAEQVKSAKEFAAKPVSRVQVLTNGQAAWSLAAISALTGAAVTLFILRHGFRVKRWLNEGEAFVVQHPYVDVAIVFVITAGYILTRTSGIIK
jgi:uncharacterized protein YkwD